MPTLFPTRNAPAIVPFTTLDEVDTPWGVAPLFDFQQNKFLTNGNNDLVLGNEAPVLSQWITSALITPRLRHYIHGRSFGSDFDLLFAKNHPRAIVKKYAEKYTAEALNDDRILRIRSIEARPYGRYVVVDCTIVPRSGYAQQFQVKWSL